MGKQGVELIVKRTQGKGQGVREFKGRVSKLKKLSPSTVQRRKNLPLSSKTSPRRSNLTQSGKLMNNIAYRKQAKSVRFYIRSREAKKAEYVSKDRPFMNLSEREFNTLLKLYKQSVRRKL